MAIIGERSRKAQPTPVARLVAPGPSVAMQSPGAPVMRPLTSAAKPGGHGCAVTPNSTAPLRIASISGSTLPLGMPKPRVMPFALRVATIRSALFMGKGAALPATTAVLDDVAGRIDAVRGGRRLPHPADRAPAT